MNRPLPSAGDLVRRLVWLGAVAVVGCGDTGTPAASNPCGATGLIFAFQVLDDGPVETGSTLLYDNGAPYFFLCGDYRYWALLDPRSDPRAGQTSAAEVERLFRLSRLRGVTGNHPGNDPLVRSTSRFTTPSGTSTCTAGCVGGAAQWTLQANAMEAPYAISMLLEQGRDADGGLRFVVVSLAGVEPPPRPPVSFRWPLATPITNFAITVEEAGRLGPGSSRAVTSPSDRAALLDLRRRHGATGEAGGRFVAITEGGVNYALWMRRTIPLEDERGVVPVAALLPVAAR